MMQWRKVAEEGSSSLQPASFINTSLDVYKYR
jgi:hypothetical protein